MLRDALEKICAMASIFLKIMLPHSIRSRPFVLNMSGYESLMKIDREHFAPVKPFAFRFIDDITTAEISSQKINISVNENMCYILENDFLRVELSPSGTVLSLKDKRVEPPREVVLQGTVGNALVLYDDVPFYWCVRFHHLAVL